MAIMANSAQSIPVHRAKDMLTQLLPRVEAGERFTITRRGKPVADLVAHTPGPPPEGDGWQRLRAAQKALGMVPETNPIPADFDEPFPDEFWFPEDDILIELFGAK